MVRPTFINLNFDELHNYILIISMNSCDDICNNIESPLGRICISIYVEGENLQVFKIIKVIDE